ncbi:Ig-like domain [Escherichia fergusonii]|nr:Ig-like domain [Escherichia fergusonii]
MTVNTGLPTITFNAISSDNVLNADEKGQPLTISGSSTGLATGAQVTVTLNGHNYSATTDAAGNWTLTVPVSDLAALGQANYTVSASATSAAGNTASSQANLLVDSGLPGVTINTVADDDIINAAEAGPIKPSASGHSCRRWRYGYRHAGRQHLHHHGTGQLKLEYQRSGSRSPGVGQW